MVGTKPALSCDLSVTNLLVKFEHQLIELHDECRQKGLLARTYAPPVTGFAVLQHGWHKFSVHSVL